MYVCMCIYIYMYLCVYVCKNAEQYAHMYTSMYTHTHNYAWMYMDDSPHVNFAIGCRKARMEDALYIIPDYD